MKKQIVCSVVKGKASIPYDKKKIEQTQTQKRKSGKKALKSKRKTKNINYIMI